MGCVLHPEETRVLFGLLGAGGGFQAVGGALRGPYPGFVPGRGHRDRQFEHGKGRVDRRLHLVGHLVESQRGARGSGTCREN
jgi:hypothetical protein